MQLLNNQKHFNMLCELFVEASIEVIENGDGKTPQGKKIPKEELNRLVAKGYLQYVVSDNGLIFIGLTPKTVRMITYIMKLE